MDIVVSGCVEFARPESEGFCRGVVPLSSPD